MIGLLVLHLVNWLLSKGIIWAVYNLFDINWYNKFWVVYVAVLLTNFIGGNRK